MRQDDLIEIICEAVRRGWTIQIEPRLIDGEHVEAAVRVFKKTEYATSLVLSSDNLSHAFKKLPGVFEKESA